MPNPADLASIASVPPCPYLSNGMSHEVRTYAGAGGERCTYVCICGLAWNQKRPDRLLPGEDPDVRQSQRAALRGKKRSSQGYKCGACGAPKKGHVCHLGDASNVKKQKMSPSPPASSPPPMLVTPLLRQQFDDMLLFSSPPTDTEVLNFLRKYDSSASRTPSRTAIRHTSSRIPNSPSRMRARI